MSFVINVDLESLWPIPESGVAIAECTCGWVWEEKFHGPVWDLSNPSTIASADQLRAAVMEHERRHYA